jgi:hypothetical protein
LYFYDWSADSELFPEFSFTFILQARPRDCNPPYIIYIYEKLRPQEVTYICNKPWLVSHRSAGTTHTEQLKKQMFYFYSKHQRQHSAICKSRPKHIYFIWHVLNANLSLLYNSISRPKHTINFPKHLKPIRKRHCLRRCLHNQFSFL